MQNNLILRNTNSPYPEDVNLGAVLNHAQNDGNFVHVKGETIYTATTSNDILTLQKRNGNVVNIPLASGTALIKVGSVNQTGNSVTLGDVYWKINGQNFSDLSQTFTIPNATDGYYRTDIIIGNLNGELVRIAGVEMIENAVQPGLPSNSVLVLVVNVYGDTVFPPTPIIDDFLKKSHEAQNIIGTIGFNPVGLMGWYQKNTYRYIGVDPLTIWTMSTFTTGDQYMYDGRLLTWINDGPSTLTLRHMANENAIKFFTPNAQNVVLTNGQIAVFKYSALKNRLELVSLNYSNGGSGSGSTESLRFGIEDSVTEEERSVDMNQYGLSLFNTGSFSVLGGLQFELVLDDPNVTFVQDGSELGISGLENSSVFFNSDLVDFEVLLPDPNKITLFLGFSGIGNSNFVFDKFLDEDDNVYYQYPKFTGVTVLFSGYGIYHTTAPEIAMDITGATHTGQDIIFLEDNKLRRGQISAPIPSAQQTFDVSPEVSNLPYYRFTSGNGGDGGTPYSVLEGQPSQFKIELFDGVSTSVSNAMQPNYWYEDMSYVDLDESMIKWQPFRNMIVGPFGATNDIGVRNYINNMGSFITNSISFGSFSGSGIIVTDELSNIGLRYSSTLYRENQLLDDSAITDVGGVKELINFAMSGQSGQTLTTDGSLYISGDTIGSNISYWEDVFTWTGGTQTFTLNFEAVVFIGVFVNGQKLLRFVQFTPTPTEVTILDELDPTDVVIIAYQKYSNI